MSKLALPAATILFVASTALAPHSSAAAIPWPEAFGDEADSTVFLTASDVLLRAPFSFAERETLWTPHGGDHVIRFLVSPDGHNLAWLTRAGDQDTARIWIGSHAPREPRANFASLLPREVGRPNYSPGTPTTRDASIRGGRFITPGPQHLRTASNSLDWMPDGSGVVFGYNEGLAHVAADSGAAWEVSSARVIEIRVLDPANIFAADLVANVDQNRIEGWHLVYPTGARWRVFPAGGLDADARWTASPTSVWWTTAVGVRTVQAHDPTFRVVAEGRMSGNWIRYIPEQRRVFWVFERRLMSLAQDATVPEVRYEFRDEIGPVVETTTGSHIGFTMADSFYVWSAASNAVRRFASPGGEPAQLFEKDGAIVLVSRMRGKSAKVTRWPAQGLEAATRELSGGNYLGFATPSGRKLLVTRRGPKPPSQVDVLDLVSGEWAEVENPGLIAWEPMREW
jgi:hypothetical protein